MLKRFWRFTVLMVVVSMLSGCFLYSWYPFYTSDLVVNMPEFNGRWMREAADQSFWTVDDTTVTVVQRDGAISKLKVAYFKINDTLYVDSTASYDMDEAEYWRFHVLPIHMLHKVEYAADTVTLYPLDSDWFREAHKEGLLDLPQVVTDQESIGLLTATSEEWVAFLTDHQDEADLFNSRYPLHFVRVKEE